MQYAVPSFASSREAGDLIACRGDMQKVSTRSEEAPPVSGPADAAIGISTRKRQIAFRRRPVSGTVQKLHYG